MLIHMLGQKTWLHKKLTPMLSFIDKSDAANNYPFVSTIPLSQLILHTAFILYDRCPFMSGYGGYTIS